MIICELCKKQPATVHVTEIARSPEKSLVLQKHMCEACASSLELPSAPPGAKAPPDIWKLLRQSAQKARAEGSHGALTHPPAALQEAKLPAE